ncbi:uncharacterized protein LOC125210852 [Salvia hispanica]|uniref:uncharacterized protein LOC125210852 n=1 Tax=Salvia hispanica TaxID=49212 RepID=UPI002009376D|nr:uncharacterized protein LOC125210852 [Salvia hispanica]
MPNGELIDGFSELYKQNIDMRLDLGILDELTYPVLTEKLIRVTLKERKHRAWHSEERCSLCLVRVIVFEGVLFTPISQVKMRFSKHGGLCRWRIYWNIGMQAQVPPEVHQ